MQVHVRACTHDQEANLLDCAVTAWEPHKDGGEIRKVEYRVPDGTDNGTGAMMPHFILLLQ